MAKKYNSDLVIYKFSLEHKLGQIQCLLTQTTTIYNIMTSEHTWISLAFSNFFMKVTVQKSRLPKFSHQITLDGTEWVAGTDIS